MYISKLEYPKKHKKKYWFPQKPLVSPWKSTNAWMILRAPCGPSRAWVPPAKLVVPGENGKRWSLQGGDHWLTMANICEHIN